MMKTAQVVNVIDDATQIDKAETRTEQMQRASEVSYRWLFEAAKDGSVHYEEHPWECVFK